MTAQVRTLMISPIMPGLSGNGLSMRMGVFAEALSRRSRLTLIVIPVAGQIRLEHDWLEELGVELIEIDPRPYRDLLFQLLNQIAEPEHRISAFRAYGRASLASYISSPLIDRVSEIVRNLQPTLVHVGRSYLTDLCQAIPLETRMTVDLDEDDLAAAQLQAKHLYRTDPCGAEWIAQDGKAYDLLIAEHGARFITHFISSIEEHSSLHLRHPSFHYHVVPNSVPIPTQVRKESGAKRILFVGTLSYGPNRDGIEWFLARVLPRMNAFKRELPKFDIVGSGFQDKSHNYGPHVSFHGFVRNLAPYYARSRLVIAPLFYGGGTRIKLLEASAYKTASVTTSFGAKGLRDFPGLFADNAAEFVDAIDYALANPERCNAIAAASFDYVQTHYNRSRVIQSLTRFFQDL